MFPLNHTQTQCYSTFYSHVFNHLDTNYDQRCLTSVIIRVSIWYNQKPLIWFAFGMIRNNWMFKFYLENYFINSFMLFLIVYAMSLHCVGEHDSLCLPVFCNIVSLFIISRNLCCNNHLHKLDPFLCSFP